MGMLGFCSSHSDPKETRSKPGDFKILKHIIKDQYSLVLVNYPGCTPFQCDKIILLKTDFLNEARKKGILDPHFNDQDSIIGRFIPNQMGWNLGIFFLENIKAAV